MINLFAKVRLRILDFLDTLKHDGVLAAASRLMVSRNAGGASFQAVGPTDRISPDDIDAGGLPPVMIASLSFIILIGGIIGVLAITADDGRPVPAPIVHLDIPRPQSVRVDIPPQQAMTENTTTEEPSAEISGPQATAAPDPVETDLAPKLTFTPQAEFSLPRAPDPALVKESSNGPLPVIAPDGREAWRVYARPFSDQYHRPRIGILIAGLGMSQSATLTAVQQLPGAVTLGFNPYARKLQDWIDQARAAGHEVMLELPMEPVNYPDDDPGPHTLLTSLNAEANLERIEWLLSRFVGYVGVTNYMGSKFTTSPDALRPVLNTLRERGLMFLDSRSSVHSVAGQIANEVGLVQASNNRFLDNKASRTAIDARLAELERIARATGSAIGIAFPYPVSIERIAAWAETLESRGLVLAPLSNLATRGVMSGPVASAKSEPTASHE